MSKPSRIYSIYDRIDEREEVVSMIWFGIKRRQYSERARSPRFYWLSVIKQMSLAVIISSLLPHRATALKEMTALSNNCQRTNSCEGYISADLPWKVVQGDEFNMDVWLEQEKAIARKPVVIYMEQTDSIQYEPRVIEALPGQRTTIKVRILRSSSGLSQIIATGQNWKPLLVSIDSGFRARLSISAPSEIETGTIRSFFVQFIDETGNPVALEAPTSVLVEVTSAEIRYDNQPWSR